MLDLGETVITSERRPRVYYPRCLVQLQVVFDSLTATDDDRVHNFTVEPREVTVERNSYRAADTATIKLDYSDAPFDPRAVKAMNATVLMGDAESADGDLSEFAEDYLIWEGAIDEPSINLSESGETVTLEGRDYTGIFLDTKWMGGAIDLTPPLEDVLAAVKATVPGLETIDFIWYDDADSVVLSKIFGKTKFAPQPDDDVWTVIVDLCNIAGLLPVIELDAMIVRGATSSVGETVVGFNYGTDVESLEFSRKLNGARNSQILVRCWDDQARKTREAKYPPDPIVTGKRVSKKGKVTPQLAAILPFSVQGAYSEADLSAKAQQIYEGLAREQVDVKLTTREMWSDNERLWLMQASDVVVVRLGKDDLGSLKGVSQAEATNFLQARGYSADVARALVAAGRRAEDLATTFYVKSARHKWSRDNGYELELELINFVGVGA